MGGDCTGHLNHNYGEIDTDHISATYYDVTPDTSVVKLEQAEEHITVIHTDQGSVYASVAYNKLITDPNIKRSMSRDTGMASLRRKIPSGIVFYLKPLNSYRRKCPLLKTNLKKYLRNCPLLKKKIKKKHFFCPLLLTGTLVLFILLKLTNRYSIYL